MTKKLFVVLVVISAMLVSFSFVIGAKKAPVQKGPLQVYEKQTIVRQQVTSMPKGTLTERQDANNLYPDRGTKVAAVTAIASAPGDKILAGPLTYTKDFCDLYGVPFYAINDWFYGLEWYANYQDPEEFGCVSVWPFEVTEVGFNIQVDYAMDIDVQGFVYDNAGTPACPLPGTEVCQTPVYTVSLPSDGHWIIGLPMTEQCCVYEPYFAVVYILTDLYGSGSDAIAEDDPTDLCRSYNDYGAGWEDLVDIYGWPGEMLLWSAGYTEPQNDCEGPADECRLQHDNGSASSYFGDWNVGDQNAVYYDPATECVDCDPVYPLMVTQVEGAFYDFATVGAVDVIFHFYEAGELCDGPGVEIYSFPATITTFFPTVAVVPVPDLLCLEDDFFLACEYNSGTTGSIPSLLFDDNPPVDTCFQWNDYIDYGWIEWWDFWTEPAGTGWLMLRAVGTCDAEECYPGEVCDLVQDPGIINLYFSGFAAGDVIAKYFDPEDILFDCLPPVYPYRIADVEFVLYDFGGMGAVDVSINVELECQDPCDGPGTQIYQSDPITVTTMYPDLAHIDLPEVVCVYEPFFITIEYATGEQGSTPSFVWADETYPCDTCHAWLYWASGGYPFWTEWNDFWEPPAGGCPIIRVSGYTESPACDVPSCDTTIEQLAGGTQAAYVWTIPDAYGDDFFNQRFEMPPDHGGRLEYFEIAFYQDALVGTPDPDFYVWLSDGILPMDNNPPYQAIADFHLAFDEIVWFPGYTTVQTYSHGIEFDPGEKFHIGYSHADQVSDVLATLSTGEAGSNRSSEWYGVWGTMQDDWGLGCNFLIHAYMCPFAAVGSTFVLKCTPNLGYATPGDPPTNVYQVEVQSVVGYNLPVTLSLLSVSPDNNITAAFVPNSVATPYTSDVAITVGGLVPCGDYTLIFEGVGDDGQTKICDVTLTVQPPYDEGLVHFFHGLQRTSNFGAIGNADTPTANFTWYGETPLFDGSIISFAPVGPWEDWDQHMALDLYDCKHVGFIPAQHMTITDIAGCAGDPVYEELYGEMSYSNFYTEEDVISCEYDSLFVIGLEDVFCTDFSIKIKIYYNPTTTSIPEMYAGIYEDWDVVGDDWGEMDTLHNIMYQYDPAYPNIVFGIMSVPFYDQYCHNMTFVYNVMEVYPPSQGGDSSFNCDAGGPGLAYLARLMQKQQYRDMGYWGEDADDHSVLIVSPPFSLDTNEMHMEMWIDFGRDLNDGMTWEQWYHGILRYAGFYRGDVDASDTLELPAVDISDLVYLINYLYKGGPAPLPFADQGDVDGQPNVKDFNCPKNNVNIGDVVYLINHVYKGGPPPIDYVRFIPQYWSRSSMFFSPFNEW